MQRIRITTGPGKIWIATLLWAGFLLLSVGGFSQGNAYFNETPPTNEIKLFAPGVISNEYGNRDMAISPGGDELFYTLQFNYGAISTIMHSKKINGRWTTPEVASFCGGYKDLEPAFSFDGNRLYFSSNRP
ncbi:MAG TPA: hypothetical protein VK588_10125, partial [Chitinophagaceae bacterium]|nr:hypothetical protein [Chitinophagaceae bacterium]